MILYFDTETTGFPKRNLPLDHVEQPKLVQLAAILADDDGTERASFCAIIRPNDWSIPAAASEIHGIDDALAARCGVDLDAALDIFLNMADRAQRVVAHNVAFDVEIMQIAMQSINWPTLATVFGAKPRACTMNLATAIVNLPPTAKMLAAGFKKPKPPKLEECIRHFFDEALEGAHDALIDVRACARVHRHLISLENAA